MHPLACYLVESGFQDLAAENGCRIQRQHQARANRLFLLFPPFTLTDLDLCATLSSLVSGQSFCQL
jgi:hypothetical protein